MLELITQKEYVELTGAPNVPNNFRQLNYEASAYVNKMTFNRINTPSDAVKYCVCLIIDLLVQEKLDVAEVGNLKSENVDGWSRSYATQDEVRKTYEDKKYDILKLYLINELDNNNTPLLYRG